MSTPGTSQQRDAREPAPRRTRTGAVLIGPPLASRYIPGAFLGLPVLALVLSPIGGAGVQQFVHNRVREGARGPLVDLMSTMAAQIVVGGVVMWALFALWALVPLTVVHRTVLFDVDTGELLLRKGPRTVGRRRTDEVTAAYGDPRRQGMGVLEFGEDQHWTIPEIGWDREAFDGLRMVQQAAGLPIAPPRAEILAEDSRARHERMNRVSAQRIGMPWREEYATDRDAFRTEFDHRRRVLGGKEDPRPGEQWLPVGRKDAG